jgi:hypothetical protein
MHAALAFRRRDARGLASMALVSCTDFGSAAAGTVAGTAGTAAAVGTAAVLSEVSVGDSDTLRLRLRDADVGAGTSLADGGGLTDMADRVCNMDLRRDEDRTAT